MLFYTYFGSVFLRLYPRSSSMETSVSAGDLPLVPGFDDHRSGHSQERLLGAAKVMRENGDPIH